MPADTTTTAFQIPVVADAFRPLLRELVTEAVAALRDSEAKIPQSDRLCYSEGEAARLLGLELHHLRDERRRGRIGASKIVKGRIRYFRSDLMKYLMDRRIEAES